MRRDAKVAKGRVRTLAHTLVEVVSAHGQCAQHALVVRRQRGAAESCVQPQGMRCRRLLIGDPCSRGMQGLRRDRPGSGLKTMRETHRLRTLLVRQAGLRAEDCERNFSPVSPARAPGRV